MKIAIYHVDAYASKLFSGNPAAGCLLKELTEEAIHFQTRRSGILSVKRNGELLHFWICIKVNTFWIWVAVPVGQCDMLPAPMIYRSTAVNRDNLKKTGSARKGRF